MANWVPNFVTRSSNDSTEFEGSWVNQFKANPFNDVGKTRQKIESSVVYKLN